MKYSKQVSNSHYEGGSYDPFLRFISYYDQKKIVGDISTTIKVPKILEVGKGTGFLVDYLSKRGFSIKSFDIAEDLNPDYVGDILEIENVVKEKFDVITCFEVLEHIRYEDLVHVLAQLERLTNHYVVISVPQIRAYLSLWMKVSALDPIQMQISLPFPRKHRFDGQHYWELGKRGFSRRKFRKILTSKFKLIDEYTDPLNPYHRFFILEKLSK